MDTQPKFEQQTPYAGDAYRSGLGRNDAPTVYVSADRRCIVSVSVVMDGMCTRVEYTPAFARALAVELVAAADALEARA